MFFLVLSACNFEKEYVHNEVHNSVSFNTNPLELNHDVDQQRQLVEWLVIIFHLHAEKKFLSSWGRAKRVGGTPSTSNGVQQTIPWQEWSRENWHCLKLLWNLTSQDSPLPSHSQGWEHCKAPPPPQKINKMGCILGFSGGDMVDYTSLIRQHTLLYYPHTDLTHPLLRDVQWCSCHVI